MNTLKAGYGLVAEFEDAHALLDATDRARQAGYRRLEAYTPYPVEGLAEALGVRRSWLPLMVLGGGLAGAVGGFFLQYYTAVIDYPLNVGGRPLNSWQAFIPVTFELAILMAVLAAFGGMLFLTKLPRGRYPLSDVSRFAQTHSDRFFLAVEGDDPAFDLEATRQLMIDLGASEVYDA